MAATDLAERQLALIAKLTTLEPELSFMGGYAEDALLAGAPTRPHEDIDLLFPRSQEDLRREQLARLGFSEWETWGEAAPGVPFYLFGQNGDMKIDLGIADEADGSYWVRVHRLAFTVDGKEAPAGYQLRLPSDLFEHPPVDLAGIRIKPVSPLGLYQLRAGIAERNSFGPLSDRHLATLEQLRQRFFPERASDELLPPCEPLAPRSQR